MSGWSGCLHRSSLCVCLADWCLLLYNGLTQGQGHTVRQYPRWGTPCCGIPPARSEGGTRGGVPPLGTPHLDLAAVPPPPHLDLAGVPSRLDLAGVPPPPPGPGWGTPPPGPGWGNPPPSWTWPGYPPRCGQTDRRVSKHNLPSYYVRGR